MPTINYSIAEEIFVHFSDFIRGVVVARGVANRLSPPGLVALLRTEEENLRKQLTSEALISHPKIVSWREAFRSLGIKPSEYRPSIEAMARRVMNGNELPSINALVDIGNVISLRYLLPIGGHSLDALTGDIILRAATGDEEFIPFGSNQVEHPDQGEFIFTEGRNVLTRRWVWRQSNHTLTEISTTFIEFNIDGLPPVSSDEIQKASDDLAGLVQQFCGGSSETMQISRFNRSIELSN